MSKLASLLLLSAPTVLFPEGTSFCPPASTPRHGNRKFPLSNKCQKMLENTLMFKDITKAVRMVGLYFLYSWKHSDELDVNIHSAWEWGYTEVNFGQVEFTCWWDIQM